MHFPSIYMPIPFKPFPEMLRKCEREFIRTNVCLFLQQNVRSLLERSSPNASTQTDFNKLDYTHHN